MKSRAAVAHKAGAPLVIETVDLEGPREGEVLVEIKATGICHTDEFTRSGKDPEGLFPSILGHEGAGVVVEVGPGVKSIKRGHSEFATGTRQRAGFSACGASENSTYPRLPNSTAAAGIGTRQASVWR